MRTAFRYATSLLFLAIVVQVGLAGYGAFNAIDEADGGPVTQKTIENGFDPHGVVGTIVDLEKIPFKDDGVVYGVHELPVTW